MLEIDLSGAVFRDKLRGCWVGKNAGGTLGTPIEEAWGREEPFDIWWYPELREGGLPNDDLEMQLVWLTALEQVGPDLTARDLARYWLDHIGYNWDEYGLSKTNLRLGLTPPISGGYNNWFIDCMGSPIRSEVWACVAPGMPRLAARYAYEDAICDHAGGESVYGELFNVAIQSAAFVVSDKRKLIEIGLSYVPEDSKTARAIRAALQAIDDGLDWKAARRRVLDATPHHVAQYSPINMGFQVIGLLTGQDFGDALCITVNCGYDTDSSGGSIGSWWGIIAGDSNLPTKWTEPFGEAISTNESWGGVRHLSDGTTPIPETLPEVVDRLVTAARTVLRAKGDLGADDIVRVTEESLYADDSVRELWSRDPLVVRFPEAQLTTSVRYDDGAPTITASGPAHITTKLSNPHPDPLTATVRLVVPTGWPAPNPQKVTVAAASSVDLSWSLEAPTRDLIENSNRLFAVVDAVGYPQEPATPVVLVGATALRATGSIPATGDAAAMLAEAQAPELEAAPADRAGEWEDVTARGNAVPASVMPAAGTVSYLQTFLRSDDALDVLLGVDAGGPVRAWLNGVELFSLDRYRPIRPSYAGTKDAYSTVTLDAGWNELLVKFARPAGAPAFECHVVVSSADELHNGLPQVGRSQYPWDAAVARTS